MTPKYLVWIGVALIAVPFLLALFSSVWLWVPVGALLSLVGVALYAFKKHHEKRVEAT